MPRHFLFLKLAYQTGMCLLALVAVTLAAIDLTSEAAEWEVTADRVIYWIFVLDYVVRFSISRSKWLFVKDHVWDLLASFPLTCCSVCSGSPPSARFCGSPGTWTCSPTP